MTLKRILFLLLSLSLVVFMSCSSDDDNPVEPGPTEFELLAEVGDAYYTAYTTITGHCLIILYIIDATGVTFYPQMPHPIIIPTAVPIKFMAKEVITQAVSLL